MRTQGTQPGSPAGALGNPLPRPRSGTAVLSTDPGANSPALHPTSPATSSVVSKLFNLSLPQFPHLEYANSSNTDVYLIVLMGRLNALISAKNTVVPDTY